MLLLGLFVRHMMLAFDKLSFGQMIKLYHNYQNYCCILTAEDNSYDLSDLETTITEDAVPTSRRQAELFVARQVTRLQTNEKAALSPSELQKKLRYLLTTTPSLAEAVRRIFYLLLLEMSLMLTSLLVLFFHCYYNLFIALLKLNELPTRARILWFCSFSPSRI